MKERTEKIRSKRDIIRARERENFREKKNVYHSSMKRTVLI